MRHLVLSCLLVACAGEPVTDDTAPTDTGPAPFASYATDIQPIWDGNCLGTCHRVPTPSEGLDLVQGVSHGAMVGQPSRQVPSMDMVAPGSLDDSYLWHKLQGTHLSVGGEGQRMPRGRSALPEHELSLVQQWIEAGAPSD